MAGSAIGCISGRHLLLLTLVRVLYGCIWYEYVRAIEKLAGGAMVGDTEELFSPPSRQSHKDFRRAESRPSLAGAKTTSSHFFEPARGQSSIALPLDLGQRGVLQAFASHLVCCWCVGVLARSRGCHNSAVSFARHILCINFGAIQLGGFKFSPRESKAVSGRGRSNPPLSLSGQIFCGKYRATVADKSLSLIPVSLGKSRTRSISSCYK